jgi:hypothetical protein
MRDGWIKEVRVRLVEVCLIFRRFTTPLIICPCFFREETAIPIQMPQLGMEFQSETEAWTFWNAYAARTRFEVKKEVCKQKVWW